MMTRTTMMMGTGTGMRTMRTGGQPGDDKDRGTTRGQCGDNEDRGTTRGQLHWELT